ncbi:DUF3817 domain-containing protein [Blastomonas sp. UPD001]|uniref:DUF3817 domain-containing protein n=1 Tax=Blastomonas sp. UPD001 TaxID=2217673 RepID=UPI0018E5000C|nr:DUF3817 domain-containing protein [Blastomonas sp. UPD001]
MSVPIDMRTPMGRLRVASRIEGVTLITLIGVAVPLKYLGGEPGFVGLMGPVHGVAFVAYLLMLTEAAAAGGWRASEVVRTALLTVIPFGPFLNDGFLARKAAAIAQAEVQP